MYNIMIDKYTNKGKRIMGKIKKIHTDFNHFRGDILFRNSENKL